MYIKSLICSLILIGPGSSPAQTKRCRLLLVVLLLVKSIMPSLEPQGCVLCFLKLYYTWSKLLSDVFFICFGMFLSCFTVTLDFLLQICQMKRLKRSLLFYYCKLDKQTSLTVFIFITDYLYYGTNDLSG